MAAVTYQLLFGTMPLKPTYIQIQMVDQTFRKVEGIVTDVPVKMDDYFVHTNFQVIEMGEDEYDPPIIPYKNLIPRFGSLLIFEESFINFF